MKKINSILLLCYMALAINAQTHTPCDPVPTEDQLRWQKMEMYAFIHYSLNTYTDQEWGFGNEDPKLFNPSDLDCRQWARVCKQAGMKGIIFTAKHHCGFCMWPSKYTEYSVKNSPWKNGKGDVVRELAEACKEEGLEYAVYLSPWDRNHPEYGKPAYVTYFRNQLRELLTEYGDMFEVWFDGANGGDGWYGGANEVRKIDRTTYYQWPETYRMIRELQPKCLIWNDGSDRGDLRWVGTEAGFIGETNWSLLNDKGDVPYEQLHYGLENGNVWCPGETNTSIRPGWFYHETENENVKSLSKLMDTYYKSVGRNSCLLLNFPIAPNGRIHPTDSLRSIAFNKMIHEVFKTDLAKKAKKKTQGNETVITFIKPTTFNRFVAEEDIRYSQRVKKFSLEAEVNGKWVSLKDELVDKGDGLTTIGHRRIICFPKVTATRLRFTITDAKCEPIIMRTSVYLAPDITQDTPDAGEKHASDYYIFFGADKVMFVTLKDETDVTGFRYLPPQDSKEGLVTHYRISATTDWKTWETLGEGEFSNIVNNPIWQTVRCKPTRAKVIRVEGLRLAQGNRMGYSDVEVLTLPMSISAQRKTSFETGWKFHRNGVINAEMPDCDDSSWRTVTLPHDFSIEPSMTIRDSRASLPEWDNVQVGPFTRLNIGNSDQGHLPGGEGWYRKTFCLPLAAGQSLDDYLSKNEVSIQFDGVYNNAEVWVNGQKTVMNMHGYMPFVANLNDVLKNPSYRLKDEKEVCIAVRSLNVDHNSRWYSGSGIFRRVWLITTGKQHLNQWDVFVDGSEVLAKKGANVKITAKVFNDDTKAASGEVVFDILDATGKIVASTTKHYQAPATTMGKRDRSGVEVNTEMLVKSPHLWSDVSPYRYTARISVISGGQQCDQMEIPFGIRTIAFSTKEGFKLNGRQVKLKGGCVHHDNGLLGAAAIEQAEIRKAELLKAQGYNAVRCSHNLPSEAFLNACDSIGLLVMDEVFDQWEKTKSPNDYGTLFSKEKLQIENGKVTPQGITNFEYDAALMVRRDRNHPSVIIWSIGNEIYQRDDPRGQEIAKTICKVIKSEDTTRPTTLANCDYWDQPGKTWDKDSYRAFENVDLGGYNYGTQFYEKDHAKYPERIIVGTENYPSAIGGTWKFVEEHPYVIGDFVWTAIDYVGEAGVGHTFERTNDAWVQLMSWPWFNAWCGDIDLTGCKKPQSYYRDVVWRRSNIEMAVRPAIPQGEHEEVRGWGWTAEERHWNWGNYLPFELRPENYQSENMRRSVTHDINAHRSDSLRVNVYSREKRVRLLINGNVIDEKDVNPDNFTASFWVAYQPGELKAEVVGKVKNEKPTSISFHTAKAPTAIQLQPLRPSITASHHDLAYIYIDVVDEDGNLCPTAELPLKVETSGTKHIAICGTGHPSDMKSFRTLTPKSFRGKAVLIIQPQDETGEVTIKVTSPNLKSVDYKLRITQ